jgi:GWxTD domain-containing protein
MMKWLLLIVLSATSFLTLAQIPLNTINHSYIYDPDPAFTFVWKAVKTPGSSIILFEFASNSTTKPITDYSIKFETRKSLSDKEGNIITLQPTYLLQSSTKIIGKLEGTWGTDSYIIARIDKINEKRAWYFFSHISRAEALYCTSDSLPIIPPFVNTGTPVEFKADTSHVFVSYYANSFPAAAPAFSKSQARVNKVLKPDSIFLAYTHQPYTFYETGLYLIQKDTSSTSGFSMRVENDYPKFATLESLAGPLIYICTKQEFEKIVNAHGDKKAFDQVILKITGNTERARNFMRNYFKRVELANTFFSSYKEGWKTDRGMMYIIFGKPDEVYLLGDREIWEYKNATVKERFHFVKSPTVFDPDNFVLIREKNFTNTWYQVIDLWRKARF